MNMVLSRKWMMMRKKYLILAGIAIGLYLATHLFYRIWEESHIAKGVTISVKDSSDLPIPSTIIRLEKIEARGQSIIAIQHETNSFGKIYIHRLTSGFYRIWATQMKCGNDPPSRISLNIQGQNTNIQYFPCG